jgi:hypothetical protein
MQGQIAMETSELPVSAKIARKILKLVAVPLIVLAVVVRFTIPPSTWWVDYVFLALCAFALILAAIGRLPGRKADSTGTETRPPT